MWFLPEKVAALISPPVGIPGGKLRVTGSGQALLGDGNEDRRAHRIPETLKQSTQKSHGICPVAPRGGFRNRERERV